MTQIQGVQLVQTELAMIFFLVVPASLGMLLINPLLQGYIGKYVCYPIPVQASSVENFRSVLEYFCLLIQWAEALHK